MGGVEHSAVSEQARGMETGRRSRRHNDRQRLSFSSFSFFKIITITLIDVMVEAERAAWVERRAAALAAEVPRVIMVLSAVCV